jgi:hypothetical protein
MILGFTGTQDGLTETQSEELERFLLQRRPARVNHGDCVGADAEFHSLVRSLVPDCEIFVYPCVKTGKRAFCKGDYAFDTAPPLDRNKAIVGASDELVACPKGCSEEVRSGTWATVRYARRRGIPVHILYPEGSAKLR